MHLKEKKILKKIAATLKKFSAQGAKKVEYGKFLYFSMNIFFLTLQICSLKSNEGSQILEPVQLYKVMMRGHVFMKKKNAPNLSFLLFSSHYQSSGRAIALPPASAFQNAKV